MKKLTEDYTKFGQDESAEFGPSSEVLLVLALVIEVSTIAGKELPLFAS